MPKKRIGPITVLSIISVAVLLSFSSCASLMSQAKTISPLSYGLSKAKTGEERYYILLKTHQAAMESGRSVSYSGIEKIDLVIPEDAVSIPLTGSVDFNNVVFSVDNTRKDIFLFQLTEKVRRIDIPASYIDDADYRKIPELQRGLYLVMVTDNKPWVENRKGYNYGHERNDIALVKNGKGSNKPVMPYNNIYSEASCRYCVTTNKQKRLANLIFNRTASSTKITNLFDVRYQNNVLLENITVHTPSSSHLVADSIISVRCCTNVRFTNIKVDGTYSLPIKSGYAFYLDNIWNFKAERLNAFGNWGVFGCNNINHSELYNCDINRFDIHCYGRDVYCYRTNFHNLYNQFSSLYGDLVYQDCHFIDFVPVLFEASYSAYTFFSLKMLNCSIKVDSSRPYLIHAGNPSIRPAEVRNELMDASWPDIVLKNVDVILPDTMKEWTLFYVVGQNRIEIAGIKRIRMSNVNIITIETEPQVRFSNRIIVTDDSLNVSISHSGFNCISYTK